MKSRSTKTATAIIINLFFLFATIGCKKEGAGNAAGAPAGKPNLTIQTVSGPDKEDCGGFDWKVIFNLNNASGKGGWIVQEITYERNIIKCPNTQDKNDKVTYWEAWRVSAGAKGDSERLSGKFNFDDEYSSPNFPDTRGSTTLTGQVKFFEDLELPAAFTRGNKKTFAGGLPATTDKPAFWDNTNAADHNLSIVWNCCINPSTSVLVTTPTVARREDKIIMDSNRLDNTGKLIFRIPNWIDGYYTQSAAQLVNIARQIQYSTTATTLHISLMNYEKAAAASTEYAAQMSKVYLLLRVLYQLPQEMNNATAKTYGGWIHPSIGNNASSFNMTWPVYATQSPSGVQLSVAPFTGMIGRNYNAAAELDYFNSNFPKSNL